jgi:hypothetical protein
MRSELIFERKTAYHSEFSSGRITYIVQNNTLQVKGRNTACLEQKPFMLEAGVSGTLLPYENQVLF